MVSKQSAGSACETRKKINHDISPILIKFEVIEMLKGGLCVMRAAQAFEVRESMIHSIRDSDMKVKAYGMSKPQCDSEKNEE